jgi:hypothetical protein
MRKPKISFKSFERCLSNFINKRVHDNIHIYCDNFEFDGDVFSDIFLEYNNFKDEHLRILCNRYKANPFKKKSHTSGITLDGLKRYFDIEYNYSFEDNNLIFTCFIICKLPGLDIGRQITKDMKILISK